MTTIGQLLQRDLASPIEEVVKVSQQDEKVVYDELRQYVATRRIKQQYLDVLGPISNFRQPTERVGVWVSGFFGSGKSSFIKNLGYILGNRPVLGMPAGRLFIDELEKQAPHDHDPLVNKVALTLNVINQQLPIQVLMFDVQVDLPAGATADPLARIMYTVLLRELDYADNDFDIAELEIELEGEGRLAEFVQRCAAAYGGAGRGYPGPVPVTLPGVSEEEFGVWRSVRRGASRLDRTGRLLHEMDPATYPAANTWSTLKRHEPELTVGLLVQRTFELAARRRPGHGVVYIIDEVGQYVAHSTARLENLRAIVEQFGRESQNRVGRMKDGAPSPVWVIISSQEKLDEVVSALGDKRVELAKVQDRFQTHIDMAPADIREVATRRVLSKNDEGERTLGRLYDQHRARLNTHTRLERTARQHEARRDEFIQFYPYLPHFIDLSIDIVSGIRGQGNAPRHIGGSNRTLIKQAYEMLVGPRTRLKDAPAGTLVTLSHIYDLLEGNLSSEIQREIGAILERAVDDPWPGRVARALALLVNVRDLPRTEENLAALLYDRLGDDSPLEDVRRAVAWLKEHQYVGQDEGGWKLLSAEEIRWDKERNAYNPPPREQNEILAEQMKELFKGPALSATRYRDMRTFRIRAEWNGRMISDGGHIPVQLRLAEEPNTFAAEVETAVQDSHNNPDTLYWVATRSDELDEAVREVGRSAAMISRYTTLQSQSRLQDAEKVSLEQERGRLGNHQERARLELARVLAAGRGVFRGSRRDGSGFGQTHDSVFRGFYDFALPDLFPKLELGIRPGLKSDQADKILKAANLNGLPGVFYGSPTGFDLVVKRDGGKFVVDVDAPLLKELRAYLDRESSYGNKVTGKGLEERFGRPPYGWEQQALMLALATLLRGGALVVTYQGQRYRDHLDPQVHNVFDSATAFRAASFAPRGSIDIKTLVAAARRYEGLTGEMVDIEETAIAAAYKALAARELDQLRTAEAFVRANNMPGMETLREYSDTLVGLRDDASDEIVLRMAQEGVTFDALRERTHRIVEGSGDRGLARLRRMRQVADVIWPELQLHLSPGAGDPAAAQAWVDQLNETMGSEAFYSPNPDLDRAVEQLLGDYQRGYRELHDQRAQMFAEAMDFVRTQSEWADVREEMQASLMRPLIGRDHEADLSEESTVCGVCGASQRGLLSDAAALSQLVGETIARLREAAAPEEARVERLRLADVIGVSPVVSTPAEVEALLERLRDRLNSLVEAGIRVILE